jgi:hypothetical protein
MAARTRKVKACPEHEHALCGCTVTLPTDGSPGDPGQVVPLRLIADSLEIDETEETRDLLFGDHEIDEYTLQQVDRLTEEITLPIRPRLHLGHAAA